MFYLKSHAWNRKLKIDKVKIETVQEQILGVLNMQKRVEKFYHNDIRRFFLVNA